MWPVATFCGDMCLVANIPLWKAPMCWPPPYLFWEVPQSSLIWEVIFYAIVFRKFPNETELTAFAMCVFICTEPKQRILAMIATMSLREDLGLMLCFFSLLASDYSRHLYFAFPSCFIYKMGVLFAVWEWSCAVIFVKKKKSNINWEVF